MKRQLLGVWAIWCVALSLFGQTHIEKQEKFLLDAEAQLDSLRIVRDQWINQNAILATQIQQNKTGDHRSYSEHRTLEKQLRQAQVLNGHIQQTEMEIEKHHRRYQESLEALLSEYQHQLDAQLVLAQNAVSDLERDQYLRESQKLLVQKTRWSQRLTTPTSQTSEIPLSISPWDNAASLQLKQEALLDQEESIRQEVGTLNDRIERLQDEENMRQKMAEMTSDMDLFSENEETMDRIAFSGHTDSRNAVTGSDGLETFDSNAKNSFNDPSEVSQSYAYLQPDPTVIADKAGAFNIEDQIEILKQYRDRLTTRADSLQSRAAWFKNQAKQWLDNQIQSQ